MDYNNKTVWITGASSGIGEELAKQFAEQGAKVILSARNTDKLNQVKDELKGEGHRIIPLDLSMPETVLHDVSAQIDSLGPIDILINNGG
ncbi:SDR family NAD(P)-dependent oxidoreductase, partial [uncultured Pseudoalteromonas sp.]